LQNFGALFVYEKENKNNYFDSLRKIRSVS
jgi:hypothetical protein